MEPKRSLRPVIVALIVGSLIIAVGLAVGLVYGLRDDNEDAGTKKLHQGGEADYKSEFGRYQYAAVAADNKICSDIGTDILARHKGNAIDAGVAALLCLNAMTSHSGGIGGGSFAVLYHGVKGWHAVDFRETAPAAATENMYFREEDRQKSKFGGMSIAVPGEVKGAVEMLTQYGSLPWKTVINPTIKLLRDGYPLSKATHKALTYTDNLEDLPGFEVFLDANKEIKPVGSTIYRPKLAKTFQTLADDHESFYTGELAQDIVDDIREADGIVTLDDLKKYKAIFKSPTKLTLPGNMTLYSMPPPGSGPVLSYIISILSGYNMDPEGVASTEAKVLSYHRIVEAMKFAYAKRSSLGDEQFIEVAELVKNLTSMEYGEETRQLINDFMTQELPYYGPHFYNVEDYGTSHLSVVDPYGNAVSITSTVNYYFGGKVIGNKTGIVFNNEMDDFSIPNVDNYYGLPPSRANFIAPGKRPMSSMCPAIVWDEDRNRVVLVTGAAGGSKITTATALSIIDTLWFNMSVPQFLDEPRFHHQLLPKEIMAYSDFSPDIKAGLEKKGHTFRNTSGISVVQMLRVHDDSIVAGCDFRKGGAPAGY